MDYRRQVTMRRDGDDFVVAFKPDGFIIYRNKDADALRKLCRSLRWEIVSDTTSSAEEDAWSLVPGDSVPAECDPVDPASAETDRAATDADLEHDPEGWIPAFRKDHAPPKI
jgi:hypothetical protein